MLIKTVFKLSLLFCFINSQNITLVTGSSSPDLQVDPTGFIYYFTYNGEIQRLSVQNGTVTNYNFESINSYPQAMALDISNGMYIAGSSSNQVLFYSFSTNAISQYYASWNNPQGIALWNGNIWVSNSGNNQVVVISLSSATVLQYVSGFITPIGIDTTENYVYVCNYGTNEILQIDQQSFGVQSFVSGLPVPHGVTVDQTGSYLYVTSHSFAGIIRVKIFDKSVVQVPINQLSQPSGIRLVSGNLYVSDIGLNRIIEIPLSIFEGLIIEATVNNGNSTYNPNVPGLTSQRTGFVSVDAFVNSKLGVAIIIIASALVYIFFFILVRQCNKRNPPKLYTFQVQNSIESLFPNYKLVTLDWAVNNYDKSLKTVETCFNENKHYTVKGIDGLAVILLIPFLYLLTAWIIVVIILVPILFFLELLVRVLVLDFNIQPKNIYQRCRQTMFAAIPAFNFAKELRTKIGTMKNSLTDLKFTLVIDSALYVVAEKNNILVHFYPNPTQDTSTSKIIICNVYVEENLYNQVSKEAVELAEAAKIAEEQAERIALQRKREMILEDYQTLVQRIKTRCKVALPADFMPTMVEIFQKITLFDLSTYVTDSAEVMELKQTLAEKVSIELNALHNFEYWSSEIKDLVVLLKKKHEKAVQDEREEKGRRDRESSNFEQMKSQLAAIKQTVQADRNDRWADKVNDERKAKQEQQTKMMAGAAKFIANAIGQDFSQ